MKKILIALMILPLVLCACKPAQPEDSAKPEVKVVGTWKVDIANTTVPATTEEDKAEEASMRLDLKSDGTYAVSGTKKPDNGKWSLKDNAVALTPDSAGGSTPPSLTVSEDGSKLSFSDTAGGKTLTVVFVKV